jgi:protein SCO1/2
MTPKMEIAASRGRVGRLVSRPWFWAVAIATLFAFPLVRSLMRDPPRLPPVMGQLPYFALTDERGEIWNSRALDGRVWVAGFLVVDRPGSDATRTMEELEKRMRKLADAFHLVTVTLDPEHDTPARLTDWARSHHANPRRWTFLTGPRPEVERLAQAFSAMAFGTAPPEARLALVDAHGRIRGAYDPSQKDAVEQLVFDAALLVNNY